jgi:DNA-binding phage protein
MKTEQTIIEHELSKIGAEVLNRMLEKKWSVSMLSHQSGVHRSVIYKIIKGEGYTISSFAAVIHALDMNLEIVIR